MEDLESKLGAILGNPQMMQQIMSIAQNFQSSPEPQPPPASAVPEIDFATIQKITSLIGKTGMMIAPYQIVVRIKLIETCKHLKPPVYSYYQIGSSCFFMGDGW